MLSVRAHGKIAEFIAYLSCERTQDNVRHLFRKVKRFKISTEHSRRSFYRAAYAIFGRIGRIVTEEVVLHLLLTKCVHYMDCSIRKTDIRLCRQQILYEIVSY